MIAQSPWVTPFMRLCDTKAIKKLAQISPPPHPEYSNIPPAAAEKLVRKTLEGIYFPSQENCEFLCTILEHMLGHALIRYRDEKTFLSNLYLPVQSDVLPICLTGPAGCGKSELLKALRRVLESVSFSKVQVGHKHPEFEVKRIWQINARRKNSITEMLRPFIEDRDAEANLFSQGNGAGYGEKTRTRAVTMDWLAETCIRRAFKDGVFAITADEFQFFTQSSAANTKVTKALLFLSSFWVPLIYAINYSLGHLLLRRPPQDRDRLLSNLMIMMPETIGGEDWVAYLNECIRVCPWIKIDAMKDGDAVHHYSFGIKRKVVELFCNAYLLMRKRKKQFVTIDDIRDAYNSVDYFTHRSDVEELTNISLGASSSKEDLKCPFELPIDVRNRLREIAEKRRERQVADAMLDSALPRTARNELVQNNHQIQIKSESDKAKRSKVRRVISPLSAENLMKEDELFGVESMQRKKRK